MAHWISDNNHFSLILQENWSEYEDEEGTYAFFNTQKWSGNLRITLLLLPTASAKKQIDNEVKSDLNAVNIRLGNWDAAYYIKETDDYLIYYWVTGSGNSLFLCSFTVDNSFKETNAHLFELNVVNQILNSIELVA